MPDKQQGKSCDQVTYVWLKSYYGKGQVKIKLVNGVPVSEVVDDKHYLLIDNELKHYAGQLDYNQIPLKELKPTTRKLDKGDRKYEL